MIGMSIKMAFDKLYQTEDDFQKAAVLSQRIFDLAMSMYNENKPEEKIEDNTEEDNLPF